MDLREKLIKYFEEQTSNTRGSDIVIYLSTMEDCKEMADEVIELVKKINDVSNRRELLLSAICQFTNRNTQKEILEVDEWLKTDYRK